MVKNPPAKRGEGHGAYSSILAGESSWAEESGGLQFLGSQSRTQPSTHAHPSIVYRLAPP